jgi:hypothetical protein
VSWGWRAWGSAWFWLVPLALLIAWGLVVLPDPGPSPRTGESAAIVELATPRGLTAAVLDDLGPLKVSSTEGIDVGSAIMSTVALDDAYDTSIYVSAMSPRFGLPTKCGPRLGSNVVLCERDPNGTLVKVIRGPEHSTRGRVPVLTANATRPDGSHLLVEIFATGRAPEPLEGLVAELTSDPLVGWQTSPANNDIGEDLPNFGRLRLRTETTRVDPPR